jgi:phosphoglycerate dehydrogenase-like enzyme
MKVLLVVQHRFPLWSVPDWVLERLRQDFPGLEFIYLQNYDAVERHIADAEVAITWSLRPEQFAAARRLRWVHSPAAAIHLFMFPEFIASDVQLTNARDVHAPVVAEHVMAQVFALAKRLPACVRFQQQHVWGQTRLWEELPRPSEIMGATLGLVGLGSIGREVVKRAVPLGMRVVAVREHPEKPAENVSAVFGPAELPRLLAESDYVVLAAPVTPATENLINAETLRHMKPNAYLINVGRGPLVDSIALADALRRRQIAGAALDVFVKEPLASDSPLWDLDNLLITPHSAGITEKLWQRHYALIHENFRRYLAGEELLALVDKSRGY